MRRYHEHDKDDDNDDADESQERGDDLTDPDFDGLTVFVTPNQPTFSNLRRALSPQPLMRISEEQRNMKSFFVSVVPQILNWEFCDTSIQCQINNATQPLLLMALQRFLESTKFTYHINHSMGWAQFGGIATVVVTAQPSPPLENMFDPRRSGFYKSEFMKCYQTFLEYTKQLTLEPPKPVLFYYSNDQLIQIQKTASDLNKYNEFVRYLLAISEADLIYWHSKYPAMEKFSIFLKRLNTLVMDPGYIDERPYQSKPNDKPYANSDVDGVPLLLHFTEALKHPGAQLDYLIVFLKHNPLIEVHFRNEMFVIHNAAQFFMEHQTVLLHHQNKSINNKAEIYRKIN